MISTDHGFNARAAISRVPESCVEVCVMLRRRHVGLRDSKDTSKPPHVFTPREWHAFISGVRAGEFDLPAAPA